VKETVTIRLNEGVPMYKGKEVILSTFQTALLFGKRKDGELFIDKIDLKYKDEQSINE